MKREVSSMLLTTRPPLAALVLITCFSMPLARFGAERTRSASRQIPKIEIKLSGPASIRASESLETQFFKATLTNRSAEPLVLFVREGYLMNAKWNWTVVDTKNQPLGMALVILGYCGTVPYSEEVAAEASHIRDKDLAILEPGESRQFPIPGGPSDNYNFPAAGIYHLAVTLTYVVPNATFYFDAHGKKQAASGYERWDLSRLSVDSFDMLQKSLSFQATSAAWDLRLPAPRVHRDADTGLILR